jgi:hypothetical protein
VASVLRVGRKDGIKGAAKFCRDLEFPFFFSFLDRECRQRPRPFSMSIFEFWEVGWECGRSLSRFFFFHRFGSVSKSERSRGQHLGVTSESLRFAFPFFCLVVAFRESEEYLVRRGRKLYFRTSCRQG